MKWSALFLLLLLSACSSPLSVTDNETGLLRDAGFSQLGGREWKTETIWRMYVHANTRLYVCDINLGGGTYRKYAVMIASCTCGEGLRRVASTHGGENGFNTLHEAIDWMHRQIDKDRGEP